MSSLIAMRTCTRVTRAMRYCAVPKRNASFWSAIVNNTPESKSQFMKAINEDKWISPLEKKRAIEEFDTPDTELSKLGFWDGLKKIYADAKRQAEEDKVNPPTLTAAATREDRRRDLEDYDIIPGTPEFYTYYKNHKQSDLALETGVPDECIDDPQLHIAMMKFDHLKQMLGVTTDAQETDLINKYFISAGVQQLEAAFQGVIPEHTFTELPIIKEVEGEHH